MYERGCIRMCMRGCLRGFIVRNGHHDGQSVFAVVEDVRQSTTGIRVLT